MNDSELYSEWCNKVYNSGNPYAIAQVMALNNRTPHTTYCGTTDKHLISFAANVLTSLSMAVMMPTQAAIQYTLQRLTNYNQIVFVNPKDLQPKEEDLENKLY